MPRIPCLLFCLGVLYGLTACSSGPQPGKPTADVPNSALDSQESIAQASRSRTVHRAGTAGFEVLGDGKEAFMARLAMVEAAQKTLDFQYFIWSDDVVGTIFAARLLAAADRGVKIRLLLDVTHGAQKEVRSAELAAHPNIEVALFNPMSEMRGIFAGNLLPLIGEVDRMQSRMHNKMLIADNTLAVGGGRNLGDGYYGIHPKHNMRDLDFIATGPVVQAATKSFDIYWNSPLTRHGDRAKLTRKDHDKLARMRRDIDRKKHRLAHKQNSPFPVSLTRTESLKILSKLTSQMIWANYVFISDPPERMLLRGRTPSPVWHTLEDTIENARKEVVIHAAYLIPQEGTLALFHNISNRGVSMKLLTNSFASIDGVLAMTGIAKRRGDILDSGATLHELNAYAAVRKDYVHAKNAKLLGMHSKGVVVDDRISFISSYNMDPRSKYINTETGVIINSPAFARRLKSYLQEDFKPENSWAVMRDEKGRFTWTAEVPGQPVIRHHKDPDVPLTKKVKFWLLTHLPLENLL
ncbi:MAG TPA: phospholipase D family protein [Prosthecobacter sp.]